MARKVTSGQTAGNVWQKRRTNFFSCRATSRGLFSVLESSRRAWIDLHTDSATRSRKLMLESVTQLHMQWWRRLMKRSAEQKKPIPPAAAPEAAAAPSSEETQGVVLQTHAATRYSDLTEVFSSRVSPPLGRVSRHVTRCARLPRAPLVRGWAVARVFSCTSYLLASTPWMVVLTLTHRAMAPKEKESQLGDLHGRVRHDVVLTTCSR